MRELDAFAAARRPPPRTSLKLGMPSDFIALVPESPSPQIDQLAADCVEAFDQFRARLTAAERNRRLAAELTKRQTKFLERYGYPYVMDEFRFHMTLTGPLQREDRRAALSALRKKLADDLHGQALAISAISIVRQGSEKARFRVVHQSSLGANVGEPKA